MLLGYSGIEQLDEVAERIEYEKALVAAFLSLPNRYLYQLKDLHLENSNLKTLAFIYLTDESEKTFENYKALGLPEQNWSKVLSSALNVNYNSCLAVRNNLFNSLNYKKLKNKTKTFNAFQKIYCVTTVVCPILEAVGSIFPGGLLAPILYGINALFFSSITHFIDAHEIQKAPENIKQSVREYNVPEVTNHFSNEIPQPQHEQNENQFVQQQSIYPRIPDIIDKANSYNTQVTHQQFPNPYQDYGL